MAASFSVGRLYYPRLHKTGSALHPGSFATLNPIECCRAYVFAAPLVFSSAQNFLKVGIASSPSPVSRRGEETVGLAGTASRPQNN